MVRTLPIAVVAGVLLLVLVSSCAPATPPAYVSLGDSLAVGVGASDPRERGYASLYHRVLEEGTNREIPFVQLGVSGETSGSFIDGPDRQLSRAESALAENPGAVVTLSIGGNDLLAVADVNDAEREAALSRYAGNLDRILRTLGDASDPAPQITVLALYNPAPGSFTDEWTGRLNETIRSVARENGVTVAAADEAFRGNEARYAHHARYPWDIHPTDEGHEALARSFTEAREDI